ncbi:hypothetical protein [Embleya sp. MST-111070]|uniref:hypothetical protein n=1 Tax=Embleya sp. MST-111070 TaxID=3398231 RepID=UPI003F73ABBB
MARILLAAVDGLQLQWLLKPDIDMAADIETLCEVLTSASARAQNRRVVVPVWRGGGIVG